MPYTSERMKLSSRRRHSGCEISWGKDTYSIGAGPLEIWVSSHKRPGAEIEQVARDGCILVSLALQHGCPLEVIHAALSRTPNNEPATIIGAAVDAVIKHEMDITPRVIPVPRIVGEGDDRKVVVEWRNELMEKAHVETVLAEVASEAISEAELVDALQV